MITDDDEFDGLAEVTPAMQSALEVLLEGGTQEQAADAARVSRETANRWARHHPGFIAEFNRRRQERSQRHAERIAAIDELAMDTIRSALTEGDRETAFKWINRKSGGLGAFQAPGPTTLEGVIDEQTEAAASRVADEFNLMRDEALRKSVGQIVPDRFAVRSGVIRRIREELGLEVEDIVVEPPWWTRECPPSSRLFACTDDETALRVARGETEHDPEVVGADVSPVSPLDLWLLAEAAGFRHIDAYIELDTDADGVHLAHLDQEFLAGLRSIPQDRLALIAADWIDSVDISAELTVSEALKIILTLTASESRHCMYLLHDYRCHNEDLADNADTEADEEPESQDRAA